MTNSSTAAPLRQPPGLSRSLAALNNAARNYRQSGGRPSARPGPASPPAGSRETDATHRRHRHEESTAGYMLGPPRSPRSLLGQSFGDKTDLASIGRRDTVEGVLLAIIVRLRVRCGRDSSLLIMKLTACQDVITRTTRFRYLRNYENITISIPCRNLLLKTRS